MLTSSPPVRSEWRRGQSFSIEEAGRRWTVSPRVANRDRLRNLVAPHDHSISLDACVGPHPPMILTGQGEAADSAPRMRGESAANVVELEYYSAISDRVPRIGRTRCLDS